MDIKNLITFKTIVETGSFTAAAEKLNYTQSTITVQINQLEQELQVKLFEKIGRRMVITSAGEKFIPYVNNVITAIDKLQYFNKELNECEGELHIGVAETYLCYKLPAILKRFTEKAPKSKLYIHSMNCYEIRNQLINGVLDIGIFYENIGGYADSLTTHKLDTYKVALFASPKIAGQFSDFITPSRKIDIPLIINEPNCIFRQIFEQYLKEKEIVLDHTIELGSIATIKRLVENDVGISFLPQFVAETEIKKGSLVEIETSNKNNELSIVCGYHKNKWISPLMQLFIDTIITQR